MPFSSRAWPRWTPSSGLPVSPISISQDTNSLGTKQQDIGMKTYSTIINHHYRGEWAVKFPLPTLALPLFLRAFTGSIFSLNWCNYGNKHKDLFTLEGHLVCYRLSRLSFNFIYWRHTRPSYQVTLHLIGSWGYEKRCVFTTLKRKQTNGWNDKHNIQRQMANRS